MRVDKTRTHTILRTHTHTATPSSTVAKVPIKDEMRDKSMQEVSLLKTH